MHQFPIQNSKQLASHLRSLRRSLGLTQAQLGQRLGLEQARIAKIERNPGSISVDQLLEILSALECLAFIQRKERTAKPPTKARVSW
jgi:HTH-type transcriptional regulator/antitoxin HipB